MGDDFGAANELPVVSQDLDLEVPFFAGAFLEFWNRTGLPQMVIELLGNGLGVQSGSLDGGRSELRKKPDELLNGWSRL